MDNLVLTAVVRDLERSLRRAHLHDVVQETRQRLRLRWDCDGRVLSLLVSMHPELPWIGRPDRRAAKKSATPVPFVAQLRREFAGRRLQAIGKPTFDRRVEWSFTDGSWWIFELKPHGANIITLDSNRAVVSVLRLPRGARERLVIGQPYVAPTLPPLPDPTSLGPTEIDAALEPFRASGEPLETVLRRRLFGLGRAAAALIVDEMRGSDVSIGSLVSKHLGCLVDGSDVPVIELTDTSDLAQPKHLWPWTPSGERHREEVLVRGDDASHTAGMWYAALERRNDGEVRRRTLETIVRREIGRRRQAEKRCAADLRGFENPVRYRRWADAILAGLTVARRSPDSVQVPDPESTEGGDLVIPVRPGEPLPRAAERLYGKHKRALRGLERANERRLELQRGGLAFERVLEALQSGAELEPVEAELRELGVAVGLRADTHAGRAAATREGPRVEGVRLFVATTGEQILAGRGARENHRLTFRLAAPHDFWFHALGVPGAHVILRNDARRSSPGAALREAAAIAAFFSDSGKESQVDVQWTMRKNVRKPRNAAPGTVVLKRFETVRVKPEIPVNRPTEGPTLGRSPKT